jgi:hypothetical protein
MARKARWLVRPAPDGMSEIQLSSWKYFHDYVVQEMLNYGHYVWRGQREKNWELVSSLDRLVIGSLGTRKSISQRHLLKFKQSIRGRRGANPTKIDSEDEWWALGQHHGLATPLLDWTESPFVALYFAFENDTQPSSGYRAVWALTSGLAKKNTEIKKMHEADPDKASSPPPLLEFVRPLQDENARLVAQSGLFTRAPVGVTADQWIRENYLGDTDSAALIKVIIPESGREECLRTLTKMNINHLSLFPDLTGSSLHCNKALQIPKY